MTTKLTLAMFTAGVMLTNGAPASAQTADQYNRATQAIQMCSSGMGAMIPECAKLRGGLGMSVVSPQDAASALGVAGGGAPTLGGFGIGSFGGLGGGGGGKAAGIAVGLLGQAMNAARNQQAAAAPTAPAANPGAIQQAISTCVQNAGGNSVAIQACLQIASAGAAPQPAAFAGQAMLPTAQRAQDSAMAAYAGAQSYQACAAANPTNWQPCLPLMNGGAATTPAANPFGALLPRR